MANRKLSCAMLYRWFKCKLKPPKNLDIERHKEIPINKDYHELLKTNGEQSMKKNYQFPNTSNFDDTG